MHSSGSHADVRDGAVIIFFGTSSNSSAVHCGADNPGLDSDTNVGGADLDADVSSNNGGSATLDGTVLGK